MPVYFSAETRSTRSPNTKLWSLRGSWAIGDYLIRKASSSLVEEKKKRVITQGYTSTRYNMTVMRLPRFCSGHTIALVAPFSTLFERTCSEAATKVRAKIRRWTPGRIKGFCEQAVTANRYRRYRALHCDQAVSSRIFVEGTRTRHCSLQMMKTHRPRFNTPTKTTTI